MPPKSKQKNNNSSNQKPKPKPRRRKRKQDAMTPLLKMVSDPCHASLAPGLYGEDEGYLTKFHNSYAETLGQAGYVVWFPDMIGDATNPSISSWLPSSGLASTTPTNTVATPYGSIAGFTAGVSAGAIQHPGADFLFATAAGCRTVSACLKLTYTGKLADTQGEIAVLTGVTANSLIDAGTPAHVNKMFNYANGTARVSLDGHEVKWRPSDTSHTFKTLSNPDAHSAYTQDPGLQACLETTVCQSLQPEAIVIAWRGCDAAFSATVDLVVGIEWVPQMTEGLVNPSPISVGLPSTYSTVTQILDRIHRAWDRAPLSMRDSAKDFVVRAAQAGITAYRANPRAQNRLL